MLFGAYTISGQTYRFAAADVANEKWRSIAVSLVIGGGLVAAFTGPGIAKLTHDKTVSWLDNDLFARVVDFLGGPGISAAAAGATGANPPYQFASTFILLAIIPLILIAIVSLVRFPPTAVENFANSGRSLRTIVTQPSFIVAVLCAVIGWGVMVLMMAATPLAMVREYGHNFEQAATVAQWHMVGMFAPSFITGWLIGRFGVLNILIAGLVLSACAALIGMSGGTMGYFLAANICVGTGWNFLFVGATTLLTWVYRPEEKNKCQGLNDALVFQSVAAFSFSGGLLQNSVGWTTVCLILIPFVVVVFIAVMWLKFTPGAAPAGLTRPGAAAAE
jgi:fucose permease